MNRLSEGAIELNDNEVFNNCSYSCYANIADALNILKAYEDTGLEPEDILSNIKTLSSELNNAFEELKEYRRLEEQGLLIKLPCKVGKTIYIVGSKYRKGTLEKWVNTGKFKLSDIEKLGKTIFLTREEAEKALLEETK